MLWNGTDSDWLVSAPNTRTLFNDATLKWLHLLGESTQTVKRHFFFFLLRFIANVCPIGAATPFFYRQVVVRRALKGTR